MTFEEAKKILEEEGFYVEKDTRPCVLNGWFTKYESPEICEAVHVVCSAGYKVLMFETAFQARKERLKKEYEKNTKAPDSAKNCIKEDSVVINPAIKESASQFNDALLDEQSKEIERLKEKNLRLGKEIARLNKTIYKKNLKIEELRKESSRHLRGKIKMFGENVDLEQMLKDKNAVLSDVAEELRLAKIREKNLVEVSQKYMEENEELKKQLADNVVDKINANALKSAESALAYKEKVIAEKDEVIADLTHELKAKHKKYVWYKGAYDAAQQILNTIADYAAKHPDKKISDQMVEVDNAEEGADHSAKVVLCGKDVVKKFKENEESVFDFFKRYKETAEELYEVADEALDQLLLFGEVIIKEEK